MFEEPDKRILWLLNHSTLRDFEVPMLVAMGYEVFIPKHFPKNSDNRSASVSYAFDETLTIPADCLAKLNAFEFYTEKPTHDIVTIINRYFSTVIVAYIFPMFDNVIDCFKGNILLRAFGLTHPSYSYYSFAKEVSGAGFDRRLARLGDRFFFAQAYPNLKEIEPPFFQQRARDLPVGLPRRVTDKRGSWTGGQNKILFVCPDIMTYPENKAVYLEFKKYFGHVPHVICGAQTVPVPNDPAVLGRVDGALYDQLFRECAVMFYHSRLPRHIHFHPAEAVCYGMPLIYMRGGMLDTLGGKDLPGACATFAEAQNKIKRIITTKDRAFIADLTHRQAILFDHFSPENNKKCWQKNFVDDVKPVSRAGAPPPLRLGILAIDEDLDTARLALRVAQALDQAATADGGQLACVIGTANHADHLIRALPMDTTIAVRPIEWIWQPRESIRIAQEFAGQNRARLDYPHYLMPEDDVTQFMDCDLWLLVGNNYTGQVAPVKKQVALVSSLGPIADKMTPRPFLYEQFFASALVQAEVVLCMNRAVLEALPRTIGINTGALLPAWQGSAQAETFSSHAIDAEQIWQALKVLS